MKNNKEKKSGISLIPLKGLVAFPNTILQFDVSKEINKKVIQEAMDNEKEIFLLTLKEDFYEGIDEEQLWSVGTYVKVKQIVKQKNSDSIRVVVDGIDTYRLVNLYENDGYLSADIEKVGNFLDTSIDNDKKERAMLELLKENFTKFISRLPELIDKFSRLLYIDNLSGMILKITTDFIPAPHYEVKQNILEAKNIQEAYERLLEYLIEELHIFDIKTELKASLKKHMDNNQKEYVLREQLKLIQNELGDTNPMTEADEYLEKLEGLNISNESKEKLKKEINRFKSMHSSSQETNVVRNYLEVVFDIPWNEFTRDNTDIKKAETILNKEHYGLEKVKERIIEYLAVRMLNKDSISPILCLVGPPGTGKTSIAKSVANALSKKYVRISLGGVSDEAEIRGHRKTYLGAMAGRFVDALRQVKVNNPVLVLDEIDKVGVSHKGDVSSALLEVLDPAQNSSFRDNFVELPIDLSKVLFIATANNIQTIPKPLYDRMEIIDISGYTESEKFYIAKEFLIEKQLKQNGLGKSNVGINDEALRLIIHSYTKEAGVRNLERQISKIFRKVAKQVLEGKKTKIKITSKNLEKYLGKEKFTFELINEKDEVGIVRGLAYTSVGGDTLQIEVNLIKGKGRLVLTGQMGDVMKESANISYTVVKSLSDEYNIDESLFEERDVHLHIPAGAVPKDGPSAGITMTTAILSAFTGIKVKKDVAMTGEISLRGRVLAIGGLKEKLFAAKLAGVKTVLVPQKNKLDIEEISEEILSGLNIIYVLDIKEVLKEALLKGK